MRSPAKRQTVHFTLWVKPSVKAELQRIAQAERLSLSRTGAAALEEWLARRSHIQHRGIFQPMIEQAIAKEMRAYSSRLALLLVRSLFTSEQTRTIAYNILRKQQPPTLTEEEVNKIVDEIMERSKHTAKRKLAQVAPELTPVIREIETWLTQPI
jgi:Glu-tRNA(Gln) amidotransferase subunit E-like FAD-binding protein